MLGAMRAPLALALVLAAVPLAACIVVVPLPLVAPGGVARPAVVAPVADYGRPPATAACAPAAGAAAAEATVIAQVNAERSARRLAPLAPAARLRAVAQGHACDNAARGVFGHVGSDGSDLTIRLARGGYPHGVAAENTGRGFAGPLQAAYYWTTSPGHAANLLHPAVREAGLGQATGRDGRPYWVLVLAQPR